MLLLLPNFQRTLGFLIASPIWGCKSKHIYFRHQKYLNDYSIISAEKIRRTTTLFIGRAAKIQLNHLPPKNIFNFFSISKLKELISKNLPPDFFSGLQRYS
jgi:hypothetical protein